jgi:hypothetical protein
VKLWKGRRKDKEPALEYLCRVNRVAQKLRTHGETHMGYRSARDSCNWSPSSSYLSRSSNSQIYALQIFQTLNLEFSAPCPYPKQWRPRLKRIWFCIIVMSSYHFHPYSLHCPSARLKSSWTLLFFVRGLFDHSLEILIGFVWIWIDLHVNVNF